MRPLLIAHRGASGYRPEHTLAAYELAIDQGADVIEPDLVSTADGVLVCRHEPEIGGTTDIASRPAFADRRTTKVIDGEAVTGWFADDLTLAELKTLRAVERLPDVRPANRAYDGRFEVPTFEQAVALAQARGVGIYPETKHPAWSRSIGLPLEEPLVAALHAVGWSTPDAPVFLQSFGDNLPRLAGMTDLRLIQLVEDGGDTWHLSPDGLDALAGHAFGIGVEKSLVLGTDLVAVAHDRGLAVHAWTFRRENRFLPIAYRSDGGPDDAGDLVGELRAFIDAGIDGFFTDNPDLGREAIRG